MARSARWRRPRCGWDGILGEATFRDRLPALVDKVKGVKPWKRRKADGWEKDHGEADAERLIQVCGSKLGLPAAAVELAELRKGDERKVILAIFLRRRKAVSADWIAKRMCMGHPDLVSRQVGSVKRDRKLQKQVNELGKMCQCGDPREAMYEAALAREPDDTLVRWNYARFFERIGRLPDAAKQGKLICERLPDASWPYYLTGSVLARLGRKTEAADYLEQRATHHSGVSPGPQGVGANPEKPSLGRRISGFWKNANKCNLWLRGRRLSGSFQKESDLSFWLLENPNPESQIGLGGIRSS